MSNWLRSWKLTIYLPNQFGYTELDSKGYLKSDENKFKDTLVFTDPIKIRFNIHKTVLNNSNSAEITIYNLNQQDESQIIMEGSKIVLEAGYEDNTGVIFQGLIVQPLRGKQNGVDYYLKLFCIDEDHYLNLAFSSGTLIKNQTRQDLAKQSLRLSNYQYRSSGIIQDLDALPNTSAIDGSISKNERPKVIFGRTNNIVNGIARMSGATTYVDNGHLKVWNPGEQPNLDNAWEVNSQTGMIGDPVQSTYQVNVTTLINPRMLLGHYIHLNNASIIQQQLPIVGSVGYPLEASGYYRIESMNYVGDSRGQEWYSHLITTTKSGKTPGMLANAWGNLLV